MLRPTIHEAISGVDVRPALTKDDKGAQGNGGGDGSRTDTISLEELERLLAWSEESGE
jgi:hypothetical protein